jgi:hypothetical protein
MSSVRWGSRIACICIQGVSVNLPPTVSILYTRRLLALSSLQAKIKLGEMPWESFPEDLRVCSVAGSLTKHHREFPTG